jgi:hypothetical protein
VVNAAIYYALTVMYAYPVEVRINCSLEVNRRCFYRVLSKIRSVECADLKRTHGYGCNIFLAMAF